MLMLKKSRNILSNALLVYFLLLGSQLLKAEKIFQQGDHCLAYQTEETILLFVDSVVVGKTCEILAQVKREGEQVQFEVSFPIRSLDSGVGMRDEDVTELLSIETHPDIRFVSNFLTLKQVWEILKRGSAKLPGILEVAGHSHEVKFPIEVILEYGDWRVTGKLVTSLSELGLELPAVLGGLVADTRNYLELLVHLRFDRVQGLAELQAASVSQ